MTRYESAKEKDRRCAKEHAIWHASETSLFKRALEYTGISSLEGLKNRKQSPLQLRAGCLGGKGKQQFRILLKGSSAN